MGLSRQIRNLIWDNGLDWSSTGTNRRRNRAADLMRDRGAGPVVLAEGDSWFCYPDIVDGAPRDVVAQLGEEMPVYTEAKPGDVAITMRQFADTAGGLRGRLDLHRPDVLLLSAGGNDLLGNGRLETFLLPGDHPISAYTGGEAYADAFWSVVGNIQGILDFALTRRPQMKAVIHGYSYTVPRPGGDWLHGPLTRLGVPQEKWAGILERMSDQFNNALEQVRDELNQSFGAERVVLADLRKAVPGHQWYDELHPSTEGFRAVCGRLRQAILTAHPLTS